MELPSPSDESNGNHPGIGTTEPADEENTNNNHQPQNAGTLHPPLGLTSTPRSSVEDLSEYTDADESISSAPTEFLAEKLQLMEEQEESNSSSSNGDRSEDSGSGNDDSCSEGEEKPTGSSESDSDATTASYSSLEDEEADAANNQKNDNDNADAGNGNDSKAGIAKVSSITKLIKEITMEPPVTISVSGVANSEPATTNATTLQAFQSTSSDSESPTEPVSQPTIAQLRAKVIPGKANKV
ncbi:hypothetical protein C0J52_02265 [Blattella germanica]|nr:hypothetical protein C0J52_02265 [Blattella germanica]